MTAYTNQENVAFTEALAAVEQLDDNTNDELAQALVAFMRSLVHDNIARSNQVRNALTRSLMKQVSLMKILIFCSNRMKLLSLKRNL